MWKNLITSSRCEKGEFFIFHGSGGAHVSNTRTIHCGSKSMKVYADLQGNPNGSCKMGYLTIQQRARSRQWLTKIDLFLDVVHHSHLMHSSWSSLTLGNLVVFKSRTVRDAIASTYSVVVWVPHTATTTRFWYLLLVNADFLWLEKKCVRLWTTEYVDVSGDAFILHEPLGSDLSCSPTHTFFEMVLKYNALFRLNWCALSTIAAEED